MGLGFDPIDEAGRNWQRADWPAAPAMTAATSITRAHQIILGRINEALVPFGLNFSRFEALALLHFTRSGSLPLGKMGTRLQVHAASVTNTIDRLEKDGLVVREAHPSDGRTTLATITDPGRTTVAGASDALGQVSFGLEGLSEVDLKGIDDSLWPLRKQAGDF